MGPHLRKDELVNPTQTAALDANLRGNSSASLQELDQLHHFLDELQERLFQPQAMEVAGAGKGEPNIPPVGPALKTILERLIVANSRLGSFLSNI